MISEKELRLFRKLLDSYKEQTMKRFTLKYRDKLISSVDRYLAQYRDSGGLAMRDEIFTKREYDFLILIAIEKDDREAIEIVSKYITE